MPISPEDIRAISKFELFHNSNLYRMESLFSGAISRELKHRDYFCRAGERAESFGLVMSGALKLIRHSPKGEDIIVHFAVQGDLVGGLLMNQPKISPFPVSAKAMGPTRVLAIPRRTFQDFWRPNADLLSRLNSILYRRMNNIQDDKTMFSSPLKARIATLLIRHLDPAAGDELQSLSISLTRQEIADALGVAVESVIRTMRDWVEDGTIKKSSERGHEFVDVGRLVKCANP